MKIAISSSGKDLNSQVDSRFGRAKYFLVLNTETGEYHVQENSQNFNALQGAGIQAAKNVAELQVEALISGHVGPKAFTALQAGKIKMYAGTEKTVKEAIEQFKNGQLHQIKQADVEGRWV